MHLDPQASTGRRFTSVYSEKTNESQREGPPSGTTNDQHVVEMASCAINIRGNNYGTFSPRSASVLTTTMNTLESEGEADATLTPASDAHK